MTPHSPFPQRYEKMLYRRCGRSGLKLPAISLGLWHNFGGDASPSNTRSMICKSFDLGITHFDLANNYGPPPGSAEKTFGRILKKNLAAYRDELVISTKAGYSMWPGPYGDQGSRKYLLSSLDQSLQRMGLDYVDIFYHHCPDPETPMEESLTALADAVRIGKTLYAGVSSYSAEQTQTAARILRELGVPLLIHQPCYNIYERKPEHSGLLDAIEREGAGCIAFCPLAQGLLTDKYLHGIPKKSRAATPTSFLKRDAVTEAVVERTRKLSAIAEGRNQSLARMALAWVLRKPTVTSALIGASRFSQIKENVKALENLDFSPAELDAIDQAMAVAE